MFYHSNHLEGSTFSIEALTRLLLEKRIEEAYFVDDVIETTNSLEVFDKVFKDSNISLDKYMLFDWHKTLKKGTADDEIHNAGVWKQYENRLKILILK